MSTQSKIITIHAATKLLQITPLKMLRLIAHQKIPAVRIGHHYWLTEKDVINYAHSFLTSINFLPVHRHQSMTTQQY